MYKTVPIVALQLDKFHFVSKLLLILFLMNPNGTLSYGLLPEINVGALYTFCKTIRPISES